MSAPIPQKDLVILTADKNAQFALRGLLTRYPSLGIKELRPDFFVHPEKDPGVLRKSHDFLRSFSQSHRHALIIMDREGCGAEQRSREEMEQQIETAMSSSGWQDRSAAVVIDPELDIWVWSDSPHVDAELGWTNRNPPLSRWLEEKGFKQENEVKPARPKEALEAALRVVRLPRSSAIYESLARKVSLSRCTDAAFAKLRQTLRGWFPLA